MCCCRRSARAGEPKIAREKRAAADLDIATTTDSMGEWLLQHWDVFDTGGDGQLQRSNNGETGWSNIGSLTSAGF